MSKIEIDSNGNKVHTGEIHYFPNYRVWVVLKENGKPQMSRGELMAEDDVGYSIVKVDGQNIRIKNDNILDTMTQACNRCDEIRGNVV